MNDGVTSPVPVSPLATAEASAAAGLSGSGVPADVADASVAAEVAKLAQALSPAGQNIVRSAIPATQTVTLDQPTVLAGTADAASLTTTVQTPVIAPDAVPAAAAAIVPQNATDPLASIATGTDAVGAFAALDGAGGKVAGAIGANAAADSSTTTTTIGQETANFVAGLAPTATATLPPVPNALEGATVSPIINQAVAR